VCALDAIPSKSTTAISGNNLRTASGTSNKILSAFLGFGEALVAEVVVVGVEVSAEAPTNDCS